MSPSKVKQQQLEQIKTHLFTQFHLTENQVAEMLPTFINALQDHIDNLETAQNQGEVDEIGRASHTIKGALLNLGITEAAEIAFQIEQQAKIEKNIENLPALTQQIRNLLSPLFA